MEPKEAIDELLLKLHLCFATNTKIGIIGSGPSGISAAYALVKLGYTNITILEKYNFVGGMCESVDIEVSNSGRINMNSLEEELFGKVQTIDYYTTVLKITGFDHIPMDGYYFGEFMDDPKAIGNPVAMQRVYNDTNIFLFWSYGNSVDIVGLKVTELQIKAVESMGGFVEKVVLQRKFKYFPHVNSQEVTATEIRLYPCF
ncbi:uncharacterized protein LOC125860576 [Solanum stenotomum]|uniref:uncharacterized protein LOC125860576 n=1 Tax=Solanum stenotomum TaxID=172797 RepID=UPI0020D03042|nr:uncharacterized protein LOC125860576 [Solanum stenotomum]